ncbi:hypothetical protein CYY_007331 [Polysphondylium violaceum]|uniref:Right handed beta helix domain-containing protein n=1 Tax=Polysphondylium violaceum TaxID=133409 RepID=A0A8J4V4Z8_9MYCE|nr:hypothetical protein CYY_007331 [Polysphondylium violaceum]
MKNNLILVLVATIVVINVFSTATAAQESESWSSASVESASFASTSSFSFSYGSNTNITRCTQWDSSYFASIQAPGFESYVEWYNGFEVIEFIYYIQPNQLTLGPQEGYSFALFNRKHSQIYNLGVRLPDLTNETISKDLSKLIFNIYVRFENVGSGHSGSGSSASSQGSSSSASFNDRDSASGQTFNIQEYDNDDQPMENERGFDPSYIDINERHTHRQYNILPRGSIVDLEDSSSFYLNIMLNDVVVETISYDQYNNTENQYQLFSFDWSQYAINTTYNLTLAYYYPPPLLGFDIICLVDNIFFETPVQQELNNDVYVDSNGNDYNGDGTIHNPFCSIQRALMAVADGYTVYVNSDLSILPPNPSWPYVVVTSPKRNISISGNGPGTQYVLDALNSTSTLSEGALFLVNSANCYISNLYIFIRSFTNIVSITSNSSIVLDNVYFDGGSNSGSQDIVFANYMSNLTVHQCQFVECDNSCIKSVALYNNIDQSSFKETYGGIYITIASYNSKTTITNSFMSSNGVQILSSVAPYDTIFLDNLNYTTNLVQPGKQYFYQGNSFTMINSLLYNSSVIFDLNQTKNVYIGNCTLKGVSVNSTGVFLISSVESGEIKDSFFTNSDNYYVPLFVVTNGNTFLMSNISVLNNLNMFVLFNSVKNVTMRNSTFIGNKNEFQIQTEWTNITLDQINYLNNSNSFLLSYSANLSLSNSVFDTNFNNLTNPIPLISLQKPFSVNITNSEFVNNFNFHIFKIFRSLNSRNKGTGSSDGDSSSSSSSSSSSGSSYSFSSDSSSDSSGSYSSSGGSESTITQTTNTNPKDLLQYSWEDDDPTLGVNLVNLTFADNIIGDLINLNSVTATIRNITVNNNFLGTFYPINSYNSNLMVYDSLFNGTSHYFYIENSQYYFSTVVWNQTLCINARSLYIYDSQGGFQGCEFMGTSPNYGFVVKNSQVYYMNTVFSGLSSFYYPLGSYENTTTSFTSCVFYNNSAGEQMMTFSKGSVSFKDCRFTKLGSPGVNIMEASKMQLIMFDNCIISCNGENNGMRIEDSDIIMINSVLANNEYPYGAFIEVFTSNISIFNTQITNNNDISFQIHNSFAILTKVILSYNHLSQVNLFTISESVFRVSDTIINLNVLIQNTGMFFLTATNTSMSDVTFIGNNLQDASVILFLYSNSHINITDNTKFQGNVSPNGLFTLYNGAHANIIDSSFMSNTSPITSIASLTDASMYILNSSFVENVSRKSGGVMLLSDSHISIVESSLQKNVANTDGGIFFADDSSFIQFESCLILNNEATYGAGGVCYSPSQPICSLDLSNQLDLNKAVYGNNLATGPVQLSIDFNNSLHVNTTVGLSVSLTDYYNETISILPSPSNFTLDVYLLPSNQHILSQSFNHTMQGLVSIPITFREPTFSQYLINATQVDSKGHVLYQSLVVQLLPCSPGYYPGGNESSCIQCSPGYFGTDGYSCMECDTEKIQCPGLNITIANQGYWIYNQSSEFHIFECDPNICLTGQCRANQTGFLCAHCDSGFQKVKQICTPCTTFNVLLLLGLIAFFCLYALAMTIFRVPTATIIFNFILAIQIICIFSHNIQYFVISPLMSFDIDYWPKTCIGPNLNYFWKKVISLGIMYLFVLPASVFFNWGQYLVLLAFSKYKSFIQETFDRNWKETLVSQLMMLYGPITYVSLSLVSCTKYADAYYLNQDASIQCYTASHLPMFIISILSIIFVTVGVPLYLFIQIKLKKRYFIKVFFEKYKAKYIWWDIVLLFRTSIFIAVTIATTFHIDAKGLVVSSIGFIFTLLNWVIKPYRSPSRNELDTHLGLIICFGGIIINSRAFSFSENQNLFNIVPGIVLSCSTLLLIVPVVHCIRSLVSPKVQFKHSYSSTGSQNYDDQPLLYHFLTPESTTN